MVRAPPARVKQRTSVGSRGVVYFFRNFRGIASLDGVVNMRSLALALIAVLTAVLLGEAALRLLGQSYYWAVARQPDPQLGWRPAPGISAWQRFEGNALIETNALGFRDVEHSPHKAPGTFRIAVLGDSFTEAVQVPLDQAWWRVMQRRLNTGACGLGAPDSRPAPARVEVLNFAVSGYSTAQALLAWRHVARRFDPDAVVLAFFVGNDLVENARALDHEALRPYLAAAGSALVLDDGFLSSPAYRFKTSSFGRMTDGLVVHSRIAQTLVQAWHVIRLNAQVRSDVPAQRRSVEPGVDDALYRQPDAEDWRGAWFATEAMLAAFAAEVREAGAQPLLMIVGTGAQVHPNPKVPAAFAMRLGVPDLGYPVRRLLHIASVRDLPALNLVLIMAAEAERSGSPLHGFDNSIVGFGHWNADGHRIAGQAAADALCQTVALKKG
jgi:lysophospholipase L1-like esterase